jgi:hypothetical protein
VTIVPDDRHTFEIIRLADVVRFVASEDTAIGDGMTTSI